MNIKDFGVEMWMAKYENDALYNIAETCVSSITINAVSYTHLTLPTKRIV